MERSTIPPTDTSHRRLRVEALETLTGTPLPDNVDIDTLAKVVGVVPRDHIEGFNALDAHVRVFWRIALTGGETVKMFTDIPSADFRAIQWEGFLRSGIEPVAGPSPALLDDYADRVTERVGLGALELVDAGLLSTLVLLIARDKAPLNIGTIRQLADEVRYPGGYQKCADAIKRLAYLGWIEYDPEARLVTIGPRSYGDPHELPWEGSMSAPRG